MGRICEACEDRTDLRFKTEGIEFTDDNGVLGVRLHPKQAGKGKPKR
jgi:hypothetical protein